jgi:hypothetical protein
VCNRNRTRTAAIAASSAPGCAGSSSVGRTHVTLFLSGSSSG